jgi:hypothetical protein
LNISSPNAEALTNATYEAVKLRLKEKSTDNSGIITSSSKTKADIFTFSNGDKIELSRSAGKHTNATLCCVDWMTKNAPSMVNSRHFRLNYVQKISLFDALRDVCRQPNDADRDILQFERISIARRCSLKLACELFSMAQKAILADLLMIALNANSQYISATVSSYRRSTKT